MKTLNISKTTGDLQSLCKYREPTAITPSPIVMSASSRHHHYHSGMLGHCNHCLEPICGKCVDMEAISYVKQDESNTARLLGLTIINHSNFMLCLTCSRDEVKSCLCHKRKRKNDNNSSNFLQRKTSQRQLKITVSSPRSDDRIKKK
jgi:hypothetical protein